MMALTTNEDPSHSWDVNKTVRWARKSNLPEEVCTAFIEHGISGSKLLGFRQNDLQHEFTILSPNSIQKLWMVLNLLQKKREREDHFMALKLQEDLIKEEKGNNPNDIDFMAMKIFNFEVETAKTQLKYQEYAHIQNEREQINNSNFETAMKFQDEFESLRILEEYDHEVAKALQDGRPIPTKSAAAEEAISLTNKGSGGGGGGGMLVDKSKKNTSKLMTLKQSGELSKDVLKESFQGLTIRGSGSSSSLSAAEPLHQARPRRVPSTKSNLSSSSVKSSDRYSQAIINECDTCYNTKIKGFHFGCNHKQCFECTQQMLMNANKDLSLLPPKCCGIEIDLSVAFIVLQENEANSLIQRCEEITCSEKLYCPNCNTFINLDMLYKSYNGLFGTSRPLQVTCHGCYKTLCIKCKTLEHFGICNGPKTEKEDKMTEELALKEGWKRCPKCAIFIEHTMGCDHMTCRACRFEFCFKCLSTWQDGKCPKGCALWQEDRLMNEGELRVVAFEQARGAPIRNVVQREQVYERVIRGLRAHDVCRHNWTRENGYRLKTLYCENCQFYLNVYGYECEGDCGQTVCHTCRFHRLPRQGWN